MISHTNDSVQILFGQKTESMLSEDLLGKTPYSASSSLPFSNDTLEAPLKYSFFQKQTHSAMGRTIKQQDLSDNRANGNIEGDYLITNKSQVGLGIFTADCLPIVFFDSTKKVVGIAHAGWRGSIARIAASSINDMKDIFGCNPKDIFVWFGPSARSCCYEVDQSFINDLAHDSFAMKSTLYHDNSTFFDIPFYNRLVLEKLGIPPSQLNFSYNICTLCSQDYCSYRREPKTKQRNITVISLK